MLLFSNCHVLEQQSTLCKGITMYSLHRPTHESESAEWPKGDLLGVTASRLKLNASAASNSCFHHRNASFGRVKDVTRATSKKSIIRAYLKRDLEWHAQDEAHGQGAMRPNRRASRSTRHSLTPMKNNIFRMALAAHLCRVLGVRLYSAAPCYPAWTCSDEDI